MMSPRTIVISLLAWLAFGCGKSEPSPEQRELQLRGGAALAFECPGGTADRDKLTVGGAPTDLDRDVKGCGKSAKFHYRFDPKAGVGIWDLVGGVVPPSSAAQDANVDAAMRTRLLVKRAEYELKCPGADLALTPNVDDLERGASGCGRSAKYRFDRAGVVWTRVGEVTTARGK
jgi:hypothetical protein